MRRGIGTHPRDDLCPDGLRRVDRSFPLQLPDDISGSVSEEVSFSATAVASSSSWSPPIRMPNSSPPNRATVSTSRKTPRKRGPSWVRRMSPCSWPRVSLISLKRSGSRIITAVLDPSLAEPRIACSTRSWNSVRLGRPVS